MAAEYAYGSIDAARYDEPIRIRYVVTDDDDRYDYLFGMDGGRRRGANVKPAPDMYVMKRDDAKNTFLFELTKRPSVSATMWREMVSVDRQKAAGVLAESRLAEANVERARKERTMIEKLRDDVSLYTRNPKCGVDSDTQCYGERRRIADRTKEELGYAMKAINTVAYSTPMVKYTIVDPTTASCSK